MTPTTYQILDGVADAFDPLLALVALAAPLFRRPRVFRSMLGYYLAGGAAIAMVYVFRALDARYRLWAFAGLDYSTHTAFATSLVVSLIALDRRWRWSALAALVLYDVLVLVMHYHGVLDIVSSSLLAAAVAALFHRSIRRGSPR